jgi:hypothetical protein
MTQNITLFGGAISTDLNAKKTRVRKQVTPECRCMARVWGNGQGKEQCSLSASNEGLCTKHHNMWLECSKPCQVTTDGKKRLGLFMGRIDQFQDDMEGIPPFKDQHGFIRINWETVDIENLVNQQIKDCVARRPPKSQRGSGGYPPHAKWQVPPLVAFGTQNGAAESSTTPEETQVFAEKPLIMVKQNAEHRKVCRFIILPPTKTRDACTQTDSAPSLECSSSNNPMSVGYTVSASPVRGKNTFLGEDDRCIARTYTKMLSPEVRCSKKWVNRESRCCSSHHKLWKESPKALTLVSVNGITYKKGLWYGTIYDFQENTKHEFEDVRENKILPCIVKDPSTGKERCFCIWGHKPTAEYIKISGFNPKRTDKRCDKRYSDYFD